jgi:hypothetical protein
MRGSLLRSRRKRAVLALTAAVAAVVLAASVVLAGGSGPDLHGRSYSPDRQAIVSTQSTATTSTTTFSQIPGLSEFPISNRGPSSVTFSARFSGAPVEVRAERDGHPLRPTKARFDPITGTKSFSFTFISMSGSRKCRHYGISWRSPTGGTATLESGNFIVTYNAARPPHHTICD